LIITQTPTRLPLGGGGTDLASYYSKFGGFFVSAALNKYNYIAVKPRFEDGFRISYSLTEIVDRVDSIQQPIIREALRLVGVTDGLEIVSIADVPGRAGLGGSSSYTVGVLNALHTHRREHISRETLAEEACQLEIERLKEPIGKQDQYVAAFGGINSYEINSEGKVRVEPLRISNHGQAELENNIMLFYTGMTRDASKILGRIKKDEENGSSRVLETMHRIKEIGYEVRDAIQSGDLDRFGELLDVHWQTKKNLSSDVSNSRIDAVYEIAKRNGAIGAKIMGAGGGGFLMLYADSGKKRLREAMTKEGMKEVRFRFDYEGSKVSLNL
jgi:D-glycero-alpha-D-manno-heptose-7-phosphate kinase